MASFSSDHPGERRAVIPPLRLPAARDVLRHVRPRYAAALAVALPLVAIVFARFGASGRALVAAFFVSCLAVLSAIDIAERRLPNRIVLPSAALVFAAQTALFPDRALEWALAAAGASLFLLVPLLVSSAAVGMGDVKLALLLGAALGSAVVTAFVLASVAAGVYALALIARYGLDARRRTIPLGPFLAAGAVAALLL
ncbi:MAG TPA: A24 family peptidase [Gaiellaceae bacterium]|nr:A24 family peptidase [Gaiellaceae bacterium]